jgi:hypothetical protein
VKEYEQLWTPKLGINDSKSMEAVFDGDIAWNFTNSTTGEMKYSQRYRGQITVDHDVSNFPFDNLVIEISCNSIFPVEKVQLVFEPVVNGHRETVKHTLSEWMVDKHGYERVEEVQWNPIKRMSKFIYAVFLRRRYRYYIYKVRAFPTTKLFSFIQVFFINFGMLMWSWVVFWMSPDEFSDRMNILLTIFLATVAFLFVISDSIPRVDYLTIMDISILLGFLILFLEGGAVFLSYVVDKNKSSSVADDIDLISRFFFPITTAVLNLVLLFNGVRLSKRRPVCCSKSVKVKARGTPNEADTNDPKAKLIN